MVYCFLKFFKLGKKRSIFALGLSASLASLLAVSEMFLLYLFANLLSKLLTGDVLSSSYSDIQSQGKFIFDLLKNYTIEFFLVFVLFVQTLKLVNVYFSNRVAHALGSEIGLSVLTSFLNHDFAKTIQVDQSEFISTLTVRLETTIYGVILSIANLINSIILLTSALIFCLITMPSSVVLVFFVLSVLYLFFYAFSGRFFEQAGNNTNGARTLLIEILTETIEALREVHVFGLKFKLIQRFREQESLLRRSQVMVQFISAVPRIIIETIVLCAVGFFSLYMKSENFGVLDTLPTLGAFALAAQRLLPAFQVIFSSIGSLKSTFPLMRSVTDLCSVNQLDHSVATELGRPIKKDVQMVNGIDLSFDRLNNSTIIDSISFSFKKGDFVLLTGPSGAGKTTLIDLVCGLLLPKSGSIEFNGSSSKYMLEWYKAYSIGVGSQKTFLVRATLKENITFFSNELKVDEQRVQQVVKLTELEELIEGFDDGIDTMVGRGGRQLSGGQAQRVALARVLYNNPSLLVLDEPLNGQDIDRKNRIMCSLKHWSKDKILIVISHDTNDRVYATQHINLG